MHLEFGGGKTIAGSIAIDMPAPAGAAGCPPLRKRYAIAEITLSGQTISFADSGGNEWTLSQRENGKALQGLLAWRQGSVEEPLAEGFTLPGGRRPEARLSGEVQLRRVVARRTGAAAATRGPTSAGKQAGHIGAIIGANVVGLGLLYGVNKLGQGSSETGSVTCSPRVCVVGAPGAPCFCEGNVLSGASCGTTPAGGRSGRRATATRCPASRPSPATAAFARTATAAAPTDVTPSAPRGLASGPGWLTLVALLAVLAVHAWRASSGSAWRARGSGTPRRPGSSSR